MIGYRTKTASKGHYYLCIRTVDMMGTNITDYIRGVVYKSEWEGKITNEHGDKNHGWSDFEDDKIDAINLTNCFIDLGTDIEEIRKTHVVYSD